MRIGELFSGYGGLGAGVQAVLGGSIAWHSEIDPGACKILAHRYPDVPNHGDITAVDWSAVEPVDVLTGGFPCQDLSLAGLRKGLRPDTRSGLWTQFAYAIDQLRPGLVVIENVRGLLSAGADSSLEPCPWCVGDGGQPSLRALGAVLGDLAGLGYDASWQGLRASDVGAPHGRFRVFVIAWPAADANLPRRGEQRGPVAVRTQQPAAQHAGDDAAAHAPCHGRSEGWPEPARLVRGSDAAIGGAPVVAHADSDALRVEPVGITGGSGQAVAGLAGADAATPDSLRGGRTGRPHEPVGLSLVGASPAGGGSSFGAWGPYGDAVRRWERVTRPAPAPTELGAKGAHRLSPRFVEWLMGLPAGWVTDVPGLSRNEMLKALGNGVVPQQAAEALRLLLPDVEAVAA